MSANNREEDNTGPLKCVCAAKFYSDNTDACDLACHPKCNKCSGPEENNCLTCLSSENREFNSVDKTCDCVDYYYYPVNVNFCCKYGCDCTNVDGQHPCNECRTGTNRDGTTKVGDSCPCNDKFFELVSDASGSCSGNCNYSCKTCDMAGNDKCTSCDDTKLR